MISVKGSVLRSRLALVEELAPGDGLGRDAPVGRDHRGPAPRKQIQDPLGRPDRRIALRRIDLDAGGAN